MSEEDKIEQPRPSKAELAELKRLYSELLERKTREGITSIYSNSLHFENSELDFKILFGELSPLPSRMTIDWSTAVTMAWAQAKLLSYYLRINLAIYESQNGKIKIPPGMFPPVPTAPADLETNPKSREVFEFAQTLHRELVAELQKTP